MLDLKRAKREELERIMIKVEEANKKLEDYFEIERKKWQDMLDPLYAILSTKDPRSAVELQADTLSLRQKLQEDITIYMNRLAREMSKFRKSKADRFEYYMTGYGIKTASSEKTVMVERDLAEKKRNVELLESHIEFLRECRYNCDQIQYSVKNLVGLLAYM
jgi:hypothetical protein